MTHELEIQRWSKTPDKTKVWYRPKDNTEWKILSAEKIGWHNWCIYIVDDEYAELRKAEADGKNIQISNKDQTKWSDWNKPMYTEDIINYRIKPESIYYYKYEQLLGGTIYTSEYKTEEQAPQDLIGIWKRIDSSRRIWNH